MHSLWLDTADGIPVDTYAGQSGFDSVVAGAGLTGLATAVLLARAGHRVAVLEARSIGAATTGHTTAKVSLLQGGQLSRITSHHDSATAAAYVAAQQEAQAWILRYCDEHQVEYDRRDAYTYATTLQGADDLAAEQRASESAGLPVEAVAGSGDLPFAVTGMLRLADQAQLHPMRLLAALVAELRGRGGWVFEGMRVTGVGHANDGGAGTGARTVTVRTGLGDVQTGILVLATGTPMLNRGGHFSVLTPKRSYAAAFTVPGHIPDGMYLSIDAPTRSLRTARHSGRELLLAGGNGHVVGRQSHTRGHVEDLLRWTQQHFPGAEPTHTWSAQDYEPAGSLPYVGPVLPGEKRVLVATGFNKWGMTNGVAAALALSASILGGDNHWAKDLYKSRISGRDAASTAETNVSVGLELLSGWLGGLTRTTQTVPPEGQGTVVRENARPVGLCTVDSATFRVSAVCTHLGGVLSWNDAETSWDCPLHGSRFSADGKVLEGPAVKDLEGR
jgi:glycine/D-amino acid oxidase-like deaminating enzyme/nitrite reductase/ring-hydroxylating ferredoxin subunit